MAPVAVGLTLAGAIVFHVAQNRLSLTGGGIAWPKSWWLGLAIVYWFVLPACLVLDRRLDAAARRPFAWLLALMAARAVVEGWMLYVSHSWSPLYGISHDVVCIVALLGASSAAATSPRQAGQRAAWPAAARRHAAVTAALFVPEIGYAAYMRTYFATAGAHPIYFVPDDAAHTMLLGVTAAIDIAATLYLIGFLRLGGHGTSARMHS
ncbi:MAG: hypothetical protein M3Z16_05570 [Pseudomonadota bacterium]|nr:hypothetical protein [Pseudomonadota bacterium]